MNWVKRSDGFSMPVEVFLQKHMLFGVIIFKHWVADSGYQQPLMRVSSAEQLSPEERLGWYVRALDHHYFTLKREGSLTSPDDWIFN
jgi:hypothetical protein